MQPSAGGLTSASLRRLLQIERFDCNWNNLHTDSLSAPGRSITTQAAIQMQAASLNARIEHRRKACTRAVVKGGKRELFLVDVAHLVWKWRKAIMFFCRTTGGASRVWESLWPDHRASYEHTDGMVRLEQAKRDAVVCVNADVFLRLRLYVEERFFRCRHACILSGAYPKDAGSYRRECAKEQFKLRITCGWKKEKHVILN